MEPIGNKIKQAVLQSDKVVFFGGAGVSTDSGIPDFRGTGGLYSTGKGAEYLLSHTCLTEEPRLFWDFYRSAMIYPDARPNFTHRALATLEKRGNLRAVVTQNIDGLHQAAGSQTVYELHGTTTKCYCARCGKLYAPNDLPEKRGVPTCTRCGGTIRPDVVLYGEALPTDVFYKAEQAIADAEVLIVGGTSLTVHPAASLLYAYKGEHLIIVNNDPTPFDHYARAVVRGGLADFFTQILE